MKGKRVFITGADGFIGSHLVEKLIELGAEVTALAWYNRDLAWGWLEGIDCRKVHGDVRDAEQMWRLINGHDLVFHLAALIDIPYSYVAPRSYIDTNVVGTLNIAEACRSVGARLVHTSTSEVYGTAQRTPQDETHPLNPQSPYAASKVAADALVSSYVKSFGLDAVTLRPFNTFGPRQSVRAVIPSMIRQALHDRIVGVGDLTTTRDFSFVDDTVSAFIAVAEKGRAGETYNSGSGVDHPIDNALGLVFRFTGQCRVVADETRKRPEASEVRQLRAGTGKISAHCDWWPRVTFVEGIQRTVEWWRGQLRTV